MFNIMIAKQNIKYLKIVNNIENKSNSSRLGNDAWLRFNGLSTYHKNLFNNPPKEGTEKYNEYLKVFDIVID